MAPLEMISLRTGYRTDTVEELSALAGLTMGVGLHLWDQEFDYAWLPVGDLGTTHYFSLVMRFWAIEVPNPKRNLIHFHRLEGGLVRRNTREHPRKRSAALMEAADRSGA